MSFQLSRAIGDAWAKQQPGVLSAEPYTSSFEASDVAFAVLCTDGVTDNVSDRELVAIVGNYYATVLATGAGDQEEVARTAARAAVDQILAKSEQNCASDNEISAAALRAMPAGDERRGRADDMTALVVFFPPTAGAPY